MYRKHLPFLGIFVSICLFVVSAACYPGGTSDSFVSVGYDWTRNFISTLFARTVLNGAASPARYIAIPAMFIFCVSIGVLFKGITGKTRSKFHKKTIEIAGIGSMVYAFLVVTPMHNLMVSIALLFFLTAMLALLHLRYVEGSWRLFLAGIICLVILLASAVLYYGIMLFGLLPIMQKLAFFSCVGWLLVLHYATFRRETMKSVSPDGRFEETRDTDAP